MIIFLTACSVTSNSVSESELYNRWYMVKLLDKKGKAQNIEKCTLYIEFFENGTYESGGYLKNRGRWSFDVNKKCITIDDTLNLKIVMLSQDTLKYTAQRGNKIMTSINVTARHCKN